VDPAKSYFEWW